MKKILPLLYAAVSLLCIGYIGSSLAFSSQPHEELGARIENSGFKKKDVSGVLTSVLDDSITNVDFQGSDLSDVGTLSASTSSISVAAISPFVDGNSGVLSLGTLAGTTATIIGRAGTAVSVNATFNMSGAASTNAGSMTQQGQLILDGDNAEMFLARKNGDAGDVFAVDTANSRVFTYGTTIQGSNLGQSASTTSASAVTFAGGIHFNIDTTSTANTTTIPSAILASGSATTNIIFHFTDVGGNAGTNNITIQTQGAELISGAAIQIIDSNYGSISIKCDGSNCFLF